ncbi:MAG: helix-turn-helix transcriptional regulator [Chloroflexota bacterium]|nr:helix-turn-helix transcriptional regulator [Chloroflexota bacterium]
MTESDFLTFAEQINVLFSARMHTTGRAYTLHDVSEGTGIAVATLSQMRTGRIKNPQLSTLRALCSFFQIPLRYFETRTVEECFALLQQPATDDTKLGELNEIAFRVTHLSPEAQQDILTIIRWVQTAEQRYKQGGDTLPPFPRLSRSNDDVNEEQGDDTP